MCLLNVCVFIVWLYSFIPSVHFFSLVTGIFPDLLHVLLLLMCKQSVCSFVHFHVLITPSCFCVLQVSSCFAHVPVILPDFVHMILNYCFSFSTYLMQLGVTFLRFQCLFCQHTFLLISTLHFIYKDNPQVIRTVLTLLLIRPSFTVAACCLSCADVSLGVHRLTESSH